MNLLISRYIVLLSKINLLSQASVSTQHWVNVYLPVAIDVLHFSVKDRNGCICIITPSSVPHSSNNTFSYTHNNYSVQFLQGIFLSYTFIVIVY